RNGTRDICASLGWRTDMMRRLMLAGAIVLAATAGQAAEAIEGNWKTASGETATIAACGSAYCVTLKTGQHAGTQIGRLAGSDGRYAGEITDPAADKTYSGSGAVDGNSLKMKGCVLKVLCKSQTWTKL